MKFTIKQLRDAMIEASKGMLPPKYIWVGRVAAKALGLPCAGAYELRKGTYVLVDDWS